MVNRADPRLADVLAVIVRILFPFPIAGFGEKDAVTPPGRPETERLT